MALEKEQIETKAQEILNQLNGYTTEDVQNLTFKIRELSRQVRLTF